MTQAETFLGGRVTLHCGDCMDVLALLPDCSIDSVCCDPPYHLTSIVKRFGAKGAAPAKSGKTGAYARASAGFMGKQWDGGDIAFRPEIWAQVWRVMELIVSSYMSAPVPMRNWAGWSWPILARFMANGRA